MLMQPVTPALVAQWQRVYDTYRPRLSPNSQSGDALVQYLQRHYPTAALDDSSFSQIVLENVRNNAFYAQKLPSDALPHVAAFTIARVGAGLTLYDRQDALFAGQDILVGIECKSGFFQVEGSSLLWDELFAYRGLDVMDLDNFYLVAEYIGCLRRFGHLDAVLHKEQPSKSR